MIPRPIYKPLALVLLPVLLVGAFWLWFTYADQPKPYYLSYRSGFLYERLVLPPLPRLPFAQPTRERYHLLAVPCASGRCLATPATFAANIPASDVLFEMPAANVRALLDRDVYNGSALTPLFWIAVGTILCWSGLFAGAAVLDYRRYRRKLNGIQILGRWPVKPSRFSGWFGRKISIDVARVNDKTAPL